MAGGWRKIGWFALIYGASLFVIGAVSLVLRAWLM